MAYPELRPNQFGTTVGLWHLNHTVTDTDPTDFSGNNYTLTNSNSAEYLAGLFGNCTDLGATNTNKSLYTASNLGVTGNRTISGWFKMHTEIGSGTQCFATHWDSTTKSNLEMLYEYNSGTRRINFRRVRQGVGIDANYYIITLGTNNWYQLTQVWDGTNVLAYINGALVGSAASSGNGSATTQNLFTLGVSSSSATSLTATNFASIYIDEVMVSSTALTANQIRQLYAYQKGLLGRYE